MYSVHSKSFQIIKSLFENDVELRKNKTPNPELHRSKWSDPPKNVSNNLISDFRVSVCVNIQCILRSSWKRQVPFFQVKDRRATSLQIIMNCSRKIPHVCGIISLSFVSSNMSSHISSDVYNQISLISQLKSIKYPCIT